MQVKSSIWLEVDSFVKGVLVSSLNISSMFRHDAHIYAYQWHLVDLYALNLSVVLYYHHVYYRGRSSESMIPSPAFNHKKFLSYFSLFTFSSLNLKITKNIVLTLSFGFLNLASCWRLTTTTVSWGRKAICSLLQVLWRARKRNQP
jgi:hypothetical protein